jgi:hypothetical protein
MTNVIAAILYTVLVTNVTNVQVHENCAACEVNPAHDALELSPSPLGGERAGVRGAVPFPRTIRRETTEILESTFIQFDLGDVPRTLGVHNRVVSRTVRKFKAKLITHEEEVR